MRGAFMTEEDKRFPTSVFRSGKDTDIATSLANERTFLAWTRTGLALVAGAIAVHTPVFDLPTPISVAFSLWLLGAAGLCIALAWHRWKRVELSIRTGHRMPGFGGPAALAAGVVVLIACVAVGVVVVAVR